MNKETLSNIFELYISGKATPNEISILKSFLENDKGLNDWLENQILSSDNNIDSDIKIRMLDNIRSEANFSSQVVTVEYKPGMYLRRIATVAAVLLPFIILLGIYLKSPNIQSFEVVADMGEKASITLPEGSKVAINSGSKIIYNNDYNQKNRDIQLDGEAFFDVKYDPEKPFVVQCKDVKIKVVGTSFGIKSYENEDNIAIVLNSGKIQLITPKEEIEMEPNDRVVYNRTTQVTSLKKVNAEDYTDWRQNRLRFENESLETIMKTISRMHNIDIVFENTELQKQYFTGTIDNTNIESVLNAIRLTSSVNYRLKNGTVYLYEKK